MQVKSPRSIINEKTTFKYIVTRFNPVGASDQELDGLIKVTKSSLGKLE
jgi:hypothetical protein